MKILFLLVLIMVLFSSCSQKPSLSTDLLPFDKESELSASIKNKKTALGAHVIVKSEGLSPGTHIFHIHENSSCEDLGQAAGGHYDLMHREDWQLSW